jgi:hypothetical protein
MFNKTTAPVVEPAHDAVAAPADDLIPLSVLALDHPEPGGGWDAYILAEAAGITAGSWYASPATHVGYELIGAGMLIVAGGGHGLPLDYDELERWTRVGYEREMRSRKGER